AGCQLRIRAETIGCLPEPVFKFLDILKRILYGQAWWTGALLGVRSFRGRFGACHCYCLELCRAGGSGQVCPVAYATAIAERLATSATQASAVHIIRIGLAPSECSATAPQEDSVPTGADSAAPVQGTPVRRPRGAGTPARGSLCSPATPPGS